MVKVAGSKVRLLPAARLVVAGGPSVGKNVISIVPLRNR